jgi:hypothetical protein
MKRLASITVAIAVAATATACSAGPPGPAVASAGPSVTSSAATAAPAANAVAFARCMRAHGLPDFPDPGASGGIRVTTGPGSGVMGANSPQYASAYAACKSLMPALHTRGSGPDRGQLLKYAQCMRAQGIKDFPDPDPRGGLALSGRGDLAPSSPLFQKAQSACKRFQPGGGGSGVSSRSQS